MSSYTQANRPMALRTPLGPDVLLLTGLSGHEGVSELFRFELRLLADRKTPVAFDKVVGQPATVELELPGGGKRYVNGIVSRLRQGRRDETFTHFRAELVPQLWLLTRKARSRVFQHLTVPEILRQVLAGLLVKVEVSATYAPRDFCVQYRETDFAFASRLMEEEGIRYYFRHQSGSHQLVVTDDATEHPDLPGQSDVPFEELSPGGELQEMKVTAWEKSQEVRSDTWTLRDHCFELPGQSLEAQQLSLDAVPVGKVTHRLKVAPGPLELYDYPGGYAQRFDGVDRDGRPQPEELQKVFTDKERTVRLRMEAEEMQAIGVEGRSYCRHFCPGFAFTLTRHFDADARYLITRVEHEAAIDGDYRTGATLPFTYGNSFRCIPAAVGYRPPRVTPRPVIAGTQTATVVAPPGEELACDSYGRVKVLFHWDREGQRDLSASCWIRVAQPWAGKGWGVFFWPRAGNEVVVAFEEGDPDQPLVVGSVYNAENMPPFPLPLRNEVTGIKSASVRGHASQNFNGVVFYDQKGDEHLSIHSERTLDFNAEWDKEFHTGRNRHDRVSNVSIGQVGGLPSGGGGGGEDYVPFSRAEVLGGLGLDSKLVVGEAVLGVIGLNELLFVGSNIQLNVNPSGLSYLGGTPPAWVDAVAGAGYGGNLLFTLGTNTLVTAGGRNIIIAEAEDTKYEMKHHAVSRLLSLATGLVTTAWSIAYAALDTLEERLVLYAVYQPLLTVLLLALLGYEAYRDYEERAAKLVKWTGMYAAMGWTDEALQPTVVSTPVKTLLKTAAALVTPIAVLGGVAGLAGYQHTHPEEQEDPDVTDDTRPGGGTGGGPETGVTHVSADETYLISANQVGIFCDPPATAVPPEAVITLLASGTTEMGKVDVRGTYGVRVTAGPPLLPPVHAVAGLPGVEIETAETHRISLQQGSIPPALQTVQLNPGTGILVSSGAMPLVLRSDTTISLTVGATSIVLTPGSIAINTPSLTITAAHTAVNAATDFGVRSATVHIVAPITNIDPV